MSNSSIPANWTAIALITNVPSGNSPKTSSLCPWPCIASIGLSGAGAAEGSWINPAGWPDGIGMASWGGATGTWPPSCIFKDTSANWSGLVCSTRPPVLKPKSPLPNPALNLSFSTLKLKDVPPPTGLLGSSFCGGSCSYCGTLSFIEVYWSDESGFDDCIIVFWLFCDVSSFCWSGTKGTNVLGVGLNEPNCPSLKAPSGYLVKPLAFKPTYLVKRVLSL